jgi:DNA-binding NtrC family response regulator
LANEEVAAIPVPETEAESKEPKAILIVEDNVLVRHSLAMMLDDMGYRPIEAETGEEALMALEKESGIAAALVDLRLPDMDGVALVRALRRADPALRVVIASGQLVSAASLAEIPGPPISTLMKPFSAQQLERTLFEDLEG